MPGNSPVGGLGRPLADQDLRGDELLAPPAGPGSWDPEGPSGAQARAQLTAQRAAALDVQGLVDRLVRDPHRLIIGEVDPQPARDLLRAPRLGPAPVLTAAVAAPDPANIGTWHRRAVGCGDPAGKPVLHVLPQRVIAGELGHLRAPSTPIGVPLRGRGPVLQQAATGRGVAAYLSRDRRRRPADPPSDLANPAALGLEDGDLLALGERQVAARQSGQTDRWHAATFTEPPGPHRLGHPTHHSGVLAGQSDRDRLPESLPMLTPRHRRPARRPHRRPCYRRSSPTPWSSHPHPAARDVATTS